MGRKLFPLVATKQMWSFGLEQWFGFVALASATAELIPVSDKSSPALFICAEL